jgi:hypothetical protein
MIKISILKKLLGQETSLEGDSDRDKARRLNNQRVLNLRQGLIRWAEKAEPFLEELIKENPEEMIGFQYLDKNNLRLGGGSFDGGDRSKRIVSVTGEAFYVQQFTQYGGDYDSLRLETSRDIASEVLAQVRPSSEYKPFRGFCYERNQLIREIEERTGRNLKREVQKH